MAGLEFGSSANPWWYEARTVRKKFPLLLLLLPLLPPLPREQEGQLSFLIP
jgi:hypothetical protein